MGRQYIYNNQHIYNQIIIYSFVVFGSSSILAVATAHFWGVLIKTCAFINGQAIYIYNNQHIHDIYNQIIIYSFVVFVRFIIFA